MSLLSELKKFRKKEKISMHIPGHKNGRGLGAYFTKNAFDIDVTEVSDTDNLQNPTGILKEAQQKCADIFGAGETHFLTGGSSLGIRAAILATMRRGEKLLIDRICHRSVFDAVVLAGIEPVFLMRDFKNDVYLGISKQAVIDALSNNPDIKGMIITSPTYYGIVSDIKGIKEALGDRFLIVDEAHGAHFVFNKNLPDTALSMGADICIQSAHKTLPALGQSSYLHIGKDTALDKNRIKNCLKMLQSTSPSYMLMTSLDEAARQMNGSGEKKLEKLIFNIDKLKARVTAKTQIRFLNCDDKTRIVADFKNTEICGYEAEELLNDYGIYAEMADFRYMVFIPSVSNNSRDISVLANALIKISNKGADKRDNIPVPHICLDMLPSVAFDKKTEEISINKSMGRICAEIVSACPPGAAIAIPGQVIDKSVIDYITENKVCDTITVIK